MRDVPASLVVFLVALPLCMGIAVASGLPPEKGILTGIVDGIVVGLLAGSPLQASGPAVIVFDLVRQHGPGGLGPILILAGLIRVAAGTVRLGGWFRAVSPAVVHGMLAGIGVLIVAGQVHVLLDHKPLPKGLDNLLAIPAAAYGGLLPFNGDAPQLALLVGFVTIGFMLGWEGCVQSACAWCRARWSACWPAPPSPPRSPCRSGMCRCRICSSAVSASSIRAT